VLKCAVLDGHVKPKICRIFKQLSMNCYIAGRPPISIDDYDIYEFALRNERIILTCDRKFAEKYADHVKFILFYVEKLYRNMWKDIFNALIMFLRNGGIYSSKNLDTFFSRYRYTSYLQHN